MVCRILGEKPDIVYSVYMAHGCLFNQICFGSAKLIKCLIIDKAVCQNILTLS